MFSPEERAELVELGYSTEKQLQFLEDIRSREGESFYRYFVGKERERVALHDQWLPVLRAYAAECRREAPALLPDDMDPRQREKHRVLRSMMNASSTRVAAAEHGVGKRIVTIVTTSSEGLAAAQELFVGPGIVVMLHRERSTWFELIYGVQAHEDSNWWYRFVWWELNEGLPDDTPWFDGDAIGASRPLASGEEYWIVKSGGASGSLAGGGGDELWVWDGARAVFVEPLSSWVS